MESEVKIIPVGFISRPHGIRGEVVLALRAGQAEWLSSQVQQLWFLNGFQKKWQAYPVSQVRPFKRGLLIKIEHVDDRNQAENWRGLAVGIPEDWLCSKEAGSAVYFHELMGFRVSKGNGEVLGQLVSFETTGFQDLGVLEVSGGRRFYIPLVEEFIQSIDFNKGVLYMTLPPGLLTADLALK